MVRTNGDDDILDPINRLLSAAVDLKKMIRKFRSIMGTCTYHGLRSESHVLCDFISAIVRELTRIVRLWGGLTTEEFEAMCAARRCYEEILTRDDVSDLARKKVELMIWSMRKLGFTD